ncbi:MAG: FitA-like ribbon-helix-helix domain-containing protein [Stackebrandtia sp.]
MTVLQVRDVPDDTVRALKAQAGEQGLSLAAFLRRELDRLASRSANAKLIERIARRDRCDGPGTDDIVAEIRRLRMSS